MPLFAIPATLRVRRFVRRDPSYAESAAFMHSFRPRGDCAIMSIQVPSEIARLCARVRELRPRAVLEIGTAGGGTLFLLAEAAADDALLVSLDLPHPGGYRRHRTAMYRSFARRRQRVLPLRADSHDVRTLERVRTALGGRALDVLFVDGDHSAAGVARDFELYAPLVRRGGLIAFHDIVPGAAEGPGDVPAFWRELKERAEGEIEEIVEDWGQRGFGIGVLEVDGTVQAGC